MYSPIGDMDIDVTSDVVAEVTADVASFRSCVPLVICSILELGHYDGPSYSPLYFHSDWNPIAQPIIQAKEKFIPFIRIVNSAHKIYKIYHPIYQNFSSTLVQKFSPNMGPNFQNCAHSIKIPNSTTKITSCATNSAHYYGRICGDKWMVKKLNSHWSQCSLIQGEYNNF